MFRKQGVYLSSDDWRGALKEIRTMVDERGQYGSVYTDREHIAGR